MSFAKLTVPPTLSRIYDLIIGWDCEFQVPPNTDEPNRLLSVQLAWKVTRGACEEGSAFWWPTAEKPRPTIDDLLALAPWHKRVLMVAHNGLAEVSHLSTGARPKVASIQKNPITFRGHKTSTGQWVQLRDTMLLAAEGAKALAACAETNRVYRKLDLDVLLAEKHPALKPPGGRRAIEAVDWLLANAPDVYKLYAEHDAWATLEYYLRFQESVWRDYGLEVCAMTAVGASQGAFLAATPDYQRLWGVESVETPDEFGKVRVKVVPMASRRATEAIAAACYKGGLNTAYKLGWTRAPMIADVDMQGAYAAAMGALPAIDWAKGPTATKSRAVLLKAVERGAYVYAHVAFHYPKSVERQQTTLGDKWGSRGLLYPLTGECYATGLEIQAALELGATITAVNHAAIYEHTDEHPFADYLASVARKRIACKLAGDKHGDLLAKLIANGLYGKLGQGLGDKLTSKVFEEDKAEKIRYSTLTSPQYAAYCTAQVRCALAALVNCALAIGAAPLCGTTDGAMVAFHTETTYDQLVAAYEATTAGQRMLEGRRRLGAEGSLEIKARGTQALVCRTRTNALWDADGSVTAGAWTGWRGAKGRDPTQRAREMAEAYGRRKTMAWVQEQFRLPTPFRIYSGGLEYRPIGGPKTLRVDPDHKRRVQADGSTVTWSTVEEYIDVRKQADALQARDHAASYEHLTKWPKGVPRPRPKIVRAGDLLRRAKATGRKLLPLDPTPQALATLMAFESNGLAPTIPRPSVFGSWRRVLAHLLHTGELAGLTPEEAVAVVDLYVPGASPTAVGQLAREQGWETVRVKREGQAVRVLAAGLAD